MKFAVFVLLFAVAVYVDAVPQVEGDQDEGDQGADKSIDIFGNDGNFDINDLTGLTDEYAGDWFSANGEDTNESNPAESLIFAHISAYGSDADSK